MSLANAHMIEEKPWERFVGFPESASAIAAAAYFEQNGLPSRVEAGSPSLDFTNVAFVLVPGHLLHRARWLWAKSDLTDSELQFLATGELDGGGTDQ
jgi:hypothetical protein